jgi:ABC-type transporter MlaC component
MSTLAIMRARIADELARDDLSSQIQYAISDAIAAYTDERFLFNESRTNTLSTVASQEFYSSTDAAFIGTLNKIDYIAIYVGDQPYQVLPMRPVDMEHFSTNGTSTGQPSWFAYYDKKIRFYPVPDGTYTIRVAAAIDVAAPATDAEASNPWMTTAERLIRSRAKLELALHVLKDLELAATMQQAVDEAFDQLKSRTNQITQIGDGRVMAMEF